MTFSGFSRPKQLLRIGNELLIDRLLRQTLGDIDACFIVVPTVAGELHAHLERKGYRNLKLVETVGSKGLDLLNIFTHHINAQHNSQGAVIFMGDTVFEDAEVTNFLSRAGRTDLQLLIGATESRAITSGMFVNKTSGALVRACHTDSIPATGCFFMKFCVVQLMLQFANQSISHSVNGLLASNQVKWGLHRFHLFADVNTLEQWEECRTLFRLREKGEKEKRVAS